VLASREALFDTLTRLDLPVTEFVVAGSAPLLLHRLRRRINDVDVVVRPRSWARAEALGPSSPALYSGAREIRLAQGNLHVLDRWFPELWDLDEVFASTDVVGTYRFLTLEATLLWKRHLARTQDLRDVGAVERFLDRTPSQVPVRTSVRVVAKRA
jgi:hypothetical protein